MAKGKIQDYVVFDFETGGFPSKASPPFTGCPLTEIAMVYVNPELEIVDKVSILFKPDYLPNLIYSEGAARVSGITLALLEKDGVSVEEAFKITKDFVQTHMTGTAKPRLVGHNIIKFDIPFFENWFTYLGEDLYKLFAKDCEDTLDWAHRVFPEAPNYKLGTMCDQYDVELIGAHRAMPDTFANAEMFIRMMKNLRGEGQVQDEAEVETDNIIKNLNEFQF